VLSSGRVHVALVGLSGSGKTVVAPVLADLLGLVAVDTDAEVARVAQRSVGEIFAEQGEATFRELESGALRALLSGPPTVIATGGGIVLAEANRSLLRDHCEVVWLRSSITTLADRIAASSEPRPLLQHGGRTALAQQLLEREDLYAEVADHVVDTDSLEPDQVARLVVSEVSRG